METFQSPGLWYLPSNPDEKIAGTLRYSPTDGLLLSLTGSLSEPFRGSGGQSFSLIHGVLAQSPYNGRFVSLMDSFQTRFSLSMPGFATQDIISNYAYIADGIIDESYLKFSKIQLHLNCLREWVNVTGIQQAQEPDAGTQETHGVTLSYRPRQPIILSNRDVRVAIEFQGIVDEVLSRRTVILKEKVFITVDGIKNLSLRESMNAYVNPIRNFFTLVTTSPAVIEEQVVYSQNFKHDDLDFLRPIYVVYQPLYKGRDEDHTFRPDEMVFSLRDVEDRLDVLFDRWMNFSEQYKAFCNIYFVLQDSPPSYLDTKFTLLMLAYDLFFEKNYREGESKLNVEALTSKLSQAVEEHSSWVLDMIPSTSALNFPWNLLRVVQEHPTLMAPLVRGDLRRFVDQVVATRRYVQQRDMSVLDRSAQGRDLYWLIEKLHILLRACILLELGIPSHEIDKIFRRNRIYPYFP